MRVIKDGRVGFAYAGTLDDESVAEVLAEARDNVAFGTPDEWAGLAVPDGVPEADVDLWRESLASFPTEEKVALATELERATLALDPRLRVEDAELRRRAGRVGRGHVHGHRPVGAGHRLLRVGRHDGRRRQRDADRLRVLGRAGAGGHRPGQGGRRRRRPGRAHARRHQAVEPQAHRGARSVRDRAVPRCPVGHPERRGRAEGPVAVRQPGRRAGRGAARHAGRRRHQPARLQRRRRSTARAWPPGARR